MNGLSLSFRRRVAERQGKTVSLPTPRRIPICRQAGASADRFCKGHIANIRYGGVKAVLFYKCGEKIESVRKNYL